MINGLEYYFNFESIKSFVMWKMFVDEFPVTPSLYFEKWWGIDKYSITMHKDDVL